MVRTKSNELPRSIDEYISLLLGYVQKLFGYIQSKVERSIPDVVLVEEGETKVHPMKNEPVDEESQVEVTDLE